MLKASNRGKLDEEKLSGNGNASGSAWYAFFNISASSNKIRPAEMAIQVFTLALKYTGITAFDDKSMLPGLFFAISARSI